MGWGRRIWVWRRLRLRRLWLRRRIRRLRPGSRSRPRMGWLRRRLRLWRVRWVWLWRLRWRVWWVRVRWRLRRIWWRLRVQWGLRRIRRWLWRQRRRLWLRRVLRQPHTRATASTISVWRRRFSLIRAASVGRVDKLGHQLGPRAHTEALVNLAYVRMHGVATESEPPRNSLF
jgi:hypothetical protein